MSRVKYSLAVAVFAGLAAVLGVLSFAGEDERTSLQKADALYEKHHYKEALEDAKRCLKLKEDEKSYYDLAQVYEKLEMYNEAGEAYRQSLRENNRIVATHFSYAQLMFQQENYEITRRL